MSSEKVVSQKGLAVGLYWINHKVMDGLLQSIGKNSRIEMEISERCKTNIQEGVVRDRERMMIEKRRLMMVLWKEIKIENERCVGKSRL